MVDEVRVGQAFRDFWWAKWEWSKLFEVYGGRSGREACSSGYFGRSESGSATSGVLVDDVKVRQALEDFWSKKLRCGRFFGKFRGRSSSGAGSSGFFVDDFRVGRLFGIFARKIESREFWSGFLVYKLRKGQALRDFWLTK
jgi:hypothetical protein